jgi:Winged helix-turn-helix DNA-binding
MQIVNLSDSDSLGAPMLEEIRRTAQQRLQQIEPLIEEAEQLRDVLEVIERRSARDRSQGHARIRAQSQAPRAPKGANKRVILELVGNTPGITPAEIARETGMKRTVVASTVSRLKRHGELREYEQGGVCLPAAVAPASKRRGSTSGSTLSERSRRLASLA